MRRVLCTVLFLAAVPCGAALAQCSNPSLTPQWDAGTSRFHCTDPRNPSATVKDDSVQPTGTKEQCSAWRDTLQAACPANDGKACRSEAKSIFNSCKRSSKGDTAGSAAAASGGPKTDASSCMTTFQQQQQACAAHKAPPPVPGQMTPPDTCLQDAIAAQSKCLANSH